MKGNLRKSWLCACLRIQIDNLYVGYLSNVKAVISAFLQPLISQT